MYKKVLVALDGSDIAEQILPHVEEITDKGCEVHLIRVALAHTRPGVDATEAQVQVVEAAEEYLSTVEERLRSKGFKVESHVHYGHAAEEILEHVNHWEFDFIALTTHGRSGVGRWLMGSVAERIVRHSPIPVLVVRASKT